MSKFNQIHVKQTKITQDVMSTHYPPKKCRKIILAITIWGEALICFYLNDNGDDVLELGNYVH